MVGFGAHKRWVALGLVGLVLCSTLALGPGLAGAQEGPQQGPQYSNWGPGMPPPDQEGVDQSGSSMAPGGPDSAGAPYAAPGPNSIAPVPGQGCQYDLRGTWRNDGRQTSGGYQSYSAMVSVRQFRSWIQAVQDDGTGYYGQCLGSRLQLDVYNGYQYVGRQYGTISGSFRLTPIPPLPYDAMPYAPAAPAPVGGGLRASFTWTTWFGSGSETWQPTYGYYPPPPLFNPGPVATPVPTATSVPQPAVPRIDGLNPMSGPVGTEVVITGSGFAADDNLVTFGPSAGLRHPDGTPGNMVARAGAPDGRTLRFTVPRTGPSGILCSDTGGCVGVAGVLLQPGRYDVGVRNGSGTSNAVSFEITGE